MSKKQLPKEIEEAQAAEAKAKEQTQAAQDQMARMMVGEQRKEQERQIKLREAEQAKAAALEAEHAKTVAALEDKQMEKCGYPNRHWTGEPPMTCERRKGHDGNHQALYMRGLTQAVAHFTDAAGLPIEEEPAPVAEPLPVQVED